MTGGAVLGGIGGIAGMRFHRPSTTWGSAADTHSRPPHRRTLVLLRAELTHVNAPLYFADLSLNPRR